MVDKFQKVVSQNAATPQAGRVYFRLVDQGDGTHALGVTIVGLDTPIELTGPMSVATLGQLDDTKIVDPDAGTATIPALMRGQLEVLQLYAQSLADAISTISPSAAMKVVALDDDGNHVLGRTDEEVTTDPEASPATVTGLLRGQLATIQLYAQKLADSISTISPSAAVKVVLLDDNAEHVIGSTNEAPVIDPEATPATVTGLLRGILAALNQIAINTTPS